eukprot:1181050-Prorocentrum_minimum.AAC.1
MEYSKCRALNGILVSTVDEWYTTLNGIRLSTVELKSKAFLAVDSGAWNQPTEWPTREMSCCKLIN